MLLHCLRGESLHLLSLICSSPRYDAGTPKGVLMMEVHKTYNEVIDYLHENHL